MSLNVIKIGGNVIDNDAELLSFLRDFANLKGPKILVHGGGKIATKMARDLGVETKMVEGRRVTSKEMLDVAVMVYAGLINKRIVARLQALGCNAIGMSGADGACITSVRRPVKTVDYGEVGDVIGVNGDNLLKLVNAGFTPVICAITADPKGNLLNTNADTVATEVAKKLSHLTATSLTFCFELDGVLADINDTDSIISLIDSSNVVALKEQGILSGGMLPKIDNALNAVTSSRLESVTIKNSRRLSDNSGTVITK